MQTVSTTAPVSAASAKSVPGWLLPTVFFFLAYLLGIYQIWHLDGHPWQKWLATIVGLPLFFVLVTYLGVISFAAFLPKLDTRMGNQTDRTIVNSLDGYSVTFLKTSRETNGAYELVEVNLGPNGGNGLHYHKSFVEEFTVEKGQLSIGLNGQDMDLTVGQRAEAPRGSIHKFYNKTDQSVRFQVKIVPGRSFEKSLRVAYGLGNTGQTGNDGLPKNFWHTCLLLGYSETYLANIPSFIQESLFPALAKIAQWKGEGKALEPFFR